MVFLRSNPVSASNNLHKATYIAILNQPRNELVRRATVPNDQYVFSPEIEEMVPIRTMKYTPREFLNILDSFWTVRGVRKAYCGNQDSTIPDISLSGIVIMKSDSP